MNKKLTKEELGEELFTSTYDSWGDGYTTHIFYANGWYTTIRGHSKWRVEDDGTISFFHPDREFQGWGPMNPHNQKAYKEYLERTFENTFLGREDDI